MRYVPGTNPTAQGILAPSYVKAGPMIFTVEVLPVSGDWACNTQLYLTNDGFSLETPFGFLVIPEWVA